MPFPANLLTFGGYKSANLRGLQSAASTVLASQVLQ